MSSAAAPAVSPGYPVRLARLADERLAVRVAGGDAGAFGAIYERYHQQLFRYCRSILREDGDAQDALQSTFERAFSALQRGQRNAPLRPWLFRIAHNEAISLIRRRTADEPAEEVEMGLAPSAEHTAGERARLATLLNDFADLPERPRSALVMRELGDLSHEEIALALEISVGAAKQAIFEARRGLQECVEGRAMACEEVLRKISDGDRRALRGRRMRAHLRDCAGCAAFAAAIPEREAQLRALTPMLAPVTAAAIFARAAGSVSGAGAGAAGGGGVGAGAALGKAGLATAAVGSKAAVVAAVVATAAAGAGGVVAVTHLTAARHMRPPAAKHGHPAPIAAGTRHANSRAVSTERAATMSQVSIRHRERGARVAAERRARENRAALAAHELASRGRSESRASRSFAQEQQTRGTAETTHARAQSRRHESPRHRSNAVSHRHARVVVPPVHMPTQKAAPQNGVHGSRARARS